VAFALRRSSRTGGDPAPPPSDDGAMTLLEHLRELRARLFKAVLAIVAGAIACAFFYDQIIGVLKEPFLNAVANLEAERELDAKLTINDAAGAFILQLKVSLVAGLVLSSPIWLWQLWAFVVPGLHRNERKWSLVFAAVAGPLFMAGILLGYYVLPKGLDILLSFTPDDVSNYIEFDKYLNFILRMLLVFGVAFEIPLFVVLLNLAGVISGKSLGRHRPWIILGTFVFAAVATPSTDPISMLFLAAPMVVLFMLSEIIARFIDRRRAGREDDYDRYDDDEISDIDVDHDPRDDAPSPLDTDD
jgi:sec-independent protein translocase protein TatC